MTTGKSRRGFASMDPERRRELQSRGGKGTPPEKRTFALDPELAKRAAIKSNVRKAKTDDEP